MISSRCKPEWLRKAKAEVEELWDQQNQLADMEYDGINVSVQMNRIDKEIHKAETKYERLYGIWQNHLAKKLELAKAKHESIVTGFPIELPNSNEIAINRL